MCLVEQPFLNPLLGGIDESLRKRDRFGRKARDAQRKLLLDLDTALIALRTAGESESTVALAGVYHNLLRMWSEV